MLRLLGMRLLTRLLLLVCSLSLLSILLLSRCGLSIEPNEPETEQTDTLPGKPLKQYQLQLIFEYKFCT